MLPTPDSYWVSSKGLERIPASGIRLLAGEYPGALDPQAAQDKAERFAQVGIELFIDLTEEGESGLRAYASDMRQAASRVGRRIVHERHAIPDMGTPTREQMSAVLEAIDKALVAGKVVYVHCFGGIGRTGTVIGCWLVRHGLAGEEALARIRRLRQGTPDGWRESPETAAQRALILDWVNGE